MAKLRFNGKAPVVVAERDGAKAAVTVRRKVVAPLVPEREKPPARPDFRARFSGKRQAGGKRGGFAGKGARGMTFCDSSFLLALLLPRDFFHVHAAPLAARFRESIPYTLLAELEVENTIRRALREGAITRAGHNAAFRQIEVDLEGSILARPDTPQSELFRLARELSSRHIPEIPARFLDILQTASALLIGATSLHTFDERQRELARVCDIKVFPVTMPKAKRKTNP